MNNLPKPTESELEILRILWRLQQASVRQVHEELATIKEAGYTNTLKLMQIMFEKKLVLRDNSSKVHLYTANISQTQAQQQFVPKFINNLFSGSSSQLVMHTLGNYTPTEQEIDEIQTMLNSLKNK